MTTRSIYATMYTNPTVAKIVSFASLEPGWHYSEGVPPSEQTIAEALRLNDALQANGFLETDAFPGRDGEIQVTGDNGPIYVEYTIRPYRLGAFVVEKDNVVVTYLESISTQEVIQQLAILKSALWASFGLSKQCTTIQERGDSQVLRSIKAATSESPSWMRTASSRQKPPSVPIWSVTTESPRTPGQRSFGTSLRASSPQAVALYSKEAQLATNVITS